MLFMKNIQLILLGCFCFGAATAQAQTAKPKVPTVHRKKTTQTSRAASATTIAARPVAAAESPAYMGAHLRFDTEILNYGTVSRNSDHNRRFRFVNDGSEQLIIGNVIPGCSCSVAQAPKEPIAPGGVGYIDVSYNMEHTGAFEKIFTVSSNSSEGDGIAIIKIRGVVK